MQTPLPPVLIVDDDPLFRLLTRLLLESHGCSVSVAGDCAEAVAQLACARPGVAIVDMIMPGIDGLATISALRSHERDLKFIACSGHDEALFRNELVRLEVPHFLPKPFTVEELLAKIRQVTTVHPAPGVL